MEAIKLLIIVFGILFIFERKPMNIIFNFIGLIIATAILLGKYDTDYLSYLLIIIYCSALTIIFGFVIMLTPSDNWQSTGISKDIRIYLLLPFIIFLTYFSFNSYEFLNNHIPTTIENLTENRILEGDWNLTIINKIGNMLYMEEINIIRFMIATLILLLALVALFYILMPTF